MSSTEHSMDPIGSTMCVDMGVHPTPNWPNQNYMCKYAYMCVALALTRAFLPWTMQAVCTYMRHLYI